VSMAEIIHDNAATFVIASPGNRLCLYFKGYCRSASACCERLLSAWPDGRIRILGCL
jgi:hypothetical protein